MISSRSFLNIAGVALPIIVWWLVADALRIAPVQLLPPLSSIATKIMQLIHDGSVFDNAWATLLRWGQGFSGGVLLGSVIGLLLGVSPRAYRLFEFPLEFLRALPVTAIFPLFLIVFGVGDESKVAMAFMPTCLLMIVNASYGVLHAGKSRAVMARIFGASPLQIFTQIVFFEALPQIFVGLRLSLSLSLAVSVVAEMFIGTDKGLGQQIYNAYLINSSETLYAYLTVLGVVGYALNKTLLQIEKRTIGWAGFA